MKKIIGMVSVFGATALIVTGLGLSPAQSVQSGPSEVEAMRCPDGKHLVGGICRRSFGGSF